MTPVDPTPDDARDARREPTDDEVVDRLRAALESRATTHVPADRPVPAFELEERTRSGRSLGRVAATAAAVAAVGLGAFVLVDQRLSDREVPATPTRAPTASVVPSPTASLVPSPTLSSEPTPSTDPAPDPTAATRTAIGPASLVVPDGYELREDRGDASSTPIGRQWCLDSDGTRDCAVRVLQMDPEKNTLSSDTEGGYASNPQYCSSDMPSGRRAVVDYRDLTVGGRSGEYRDVRWTCGDGSVVDVVQVTVVTPQAWTVLADRATPASRELLAEVVASLELPAATSSVRLYDHGVLRSVEPVDGGRVRLAIDRVVVGWPNRNATTYAYLAPEGLEAGGRPLDELVGDTVTVRTDGTVVTDVILGPGTD